MLIGRTKFMFAKRILQVGAPRAVESASRKLRETFTLHLNSAAAARRTAPGPPTAPTPLGSLVATIANYKSVRLPARFRRIKTLKIYFHGFYFRFFVHRTESNHKLSNRL
ncbi:hypothetical protein EVAR_4987_1 [Eumeta japonica]|uniref:Uncharacterized protein n=1 Tax=Eumeta variegata TaxID=151549 RepID=A0A4C1UZ50_EUMVA|nr:hypothetical protein EVAR_4987_1 [Eumeta japonica]